MGKALNNKSQGRKPGYRSRRLLTSVAAEDLLVDDGGDGKAIKTIREGLPQFDVEPALTYRIKRWIEA